MLITRSWRWGVPLLLAIVLALAAYLGWLGWQVNRDLSAAVDDAERLQQAVSDGDEPAAETALADLQEHSGSAADVTSGWGWGLAELAPFVGDDAEGVALVSSVIDDLSHDGLPGLVTASQDLEAMLPKNGRVPVAPLRDLQGPVAAGHAAFADADDRLASTDASGFVDTLRTKYRDLADRVADTARTLAAADKALVVLPTMLGGDEPREYLLVYQNNAEIRTTGGLPGAVSLLEVDDGRIEMTRQVAGNSFGRAPEPVLPLTAEEEGLYGHHLGTYFLDAGFTPDFPRTAELMKARWEQEYADDIDGVISIDTVAMAYLLEATGPVQVGDVELTADNVVDELLHQVYVRYEEPAAQDAFFALVARTVFDRLSGGVGSPESLMRGLGDATRDGRVLVHSFDDAEQQQLAGTRVAGELVTDAGAAPQVGVYLNDFTGSKMSYFLRYDVKVDATYCQGGVQGLSGHATLRSEAPADAATSLPDYVTGGGAFGVKPGNQTVVVRIYAPVGGTLKKVMMRSTPLDAFTLEHEGRKVAQVWVELKPGEEVDLDWTMTTGPDQIGDTNLTVTPGITPGTESRTVASACD